MIQLSHLYMTTGKAIALNIWNFVGKLMSLLFNTLSRIIIAFLPRSKCLLISWLQSSSAVILEPKKIKSVTVSIVSPSIYHEVMELDVMTEFFECRVLSQIFNSPLSLSSKGFLVLLQFSSVQFSSVTQSCPTFCNPMDCSMPDFPVHHQLPELAQTHVHWVSDAIQPLCHPHLLLPSVFPNIRIFSNEWVLHIRLPKYWSFSFSISPSNVYSGLISFRMDWLDLTAVQGTNKGLLQHHRSKESVLWCSICSIVQLSHPYMTTGKNRDLSRQTFVGRVLSLIFNRLCRLVIAFLPRNKHLLISWLQSPSAVIFGTPQK